MRPEEFGPFLMQQRKRRQLTQTELAEQLHVSTAAVSKWERGKCLPEVSKLEDIAQVLDISILEVMRCQISEAPVPRETVQETYAQTATLTRRHYRRIAVKTGAVLLTAVLLAGFLHFFPLHRVAKVWWPSYYETGEISQLAYIGSREDRSQAQEILKMADAAFSDLDTPAEELEETYGLLKRYAVGQKQDAVSESHSLELWSAHFSASYGIMWVYYSREVYNDKGETVRGSWDCKSLWYLEKINGQWQVVAIKEHP